MTLGRIMKSAILATAVTLGFVASASAAPYPERPVTIIVPWGAGGATDVVARILAEGLKEEFKQSFIVENKPGATTAIGASQVARSPKDGYTLMLTTGTTSVTNPLIAKDLTYKPEDFAGIALVAAVPYALVTGKAFAGKTLQDYIDYAKQNPGKVTYGTSGVGSFTHFLGRKISRTLGIESRPVAYSGNGPALADTISGQISSNIEALATGSAQIKNGVFTGLAIATKKRVSQLPDLPTFEELGFKGLDMENWFAMFAPAGTPPEIIAKLNAALTKITTSPAYVQKMDELSTPARSSTPEELEALIRRDTAAFRELLASESK